MRSFMKTLSQTLLRSVLALAILALLVFTVAAQGNQQQGARYGDPNFEGEKINLNVVNADIRDILNYITEQYGVNFVIDKSVKQVPVTVNVSDVPWNVALKSVLDANGLAIDSNGTILRVADATVLAQEADVRKRNLENQLDTSPLYTEFIRLNYARASGTLGTAAGATGGFTGGGSSGSSFGGDTTGGGGDQGVMPIIRRRLSRRGNIEVDGRSNTLIITDVRQNIDSIRQLVALLDQPEPQVEIEARIVVASRSFARDLGVQFSAFGFGSNGAGGTAATVGGAATPGRGAISGNASDRSIIGLTTGMIGSFQLNALINLAESKGQAKTISTPRITTLNNRSAQIESGSQIPVVTTQLSNGGATGGGGTVFTTTFISVPLRLSVTPQISDNGTVILRVVTENNTVNRSLTSSTGTPGIDTQRMQTEVLVPNGGTTVVGGALLDNESENRTQTPGLGSIPIVGNLFKTRSTSRVSQEILFFITPRIYRPDAEGNPTAAGKTSDSQRSNTILQPVPLGNPATNSNTPTNNPAPQPASPAQQPLIVQPSVTTPTTTPAQPTTPQRQLS